jgi:hypothetical protein
MYKTHTAQTQSWFSRDGKTFDSRDPDGDDTDDILDGKIRDPVVIQGSTLPVRVYERGSIQEWLRRNPTDPFTRQNFGHQYVINTVKDINPETKYKYDDLGRPIFTCEYIESLKSQGLWRDDLLMQVRAGESVEYIIDVSRNVFMLIKDVHGNILRGRMVGGPGSSGYHPSLR